MTRGASSLYLHVLWLVLAFLPCSIFQVGCRAFTDGREGAFRQTGMTYSDFIYFMLAEEDKASDAAISYW